MALTDSQANGRILEAGPRVKITLAGTVAKGDVLGYSSGWKRALGTVGGVIQGKLVALEDGVSGEIIEAAGSAMVDGRYAGGTHGAVLYVAEGTDAGKVTETIPTTQNDATTPVGRMVDATTAYLILGNAALTLAP